MKHFRDHPSFRSYYGLVGGHRETHTKLKPSASIHDTVPTDIEDDGPRPPRYGDLVEPQPSGPRPVVRDGETMKDRETFEDSDADRWDAEHK